MKTYTLIGTDGRPYQSEHKGTLGGTRRNKLYGRLDCSTALRAIADEQYIEDPYTNYRAFFADEATAIAAGYRPCHNCMRAAYKSWRASRPS